MPEPNSPIRYAVVGLGEITQDAVLPAFAHAENSKLAALVTGSSEKAEALGSRYNVGRIVSYDGYDELLQGGEIDAVYIALPNDMHAEYTVRAAQAGVHVLCEKPMAVTEDECLQMISATNDAGVKLMIAYRLHFEEGTLESIRTAQRGDLGQLRIFNSVFTQNVSSPGDIRLSYPAAQGGGPAFDMGVYCINAARYLFSDEPYEAFAVSASRKDPRFEKVAEMTSVILRFSHDRLATFTAGFGSSAHDSLTLVGTKGTLQLDPAYGYEKGIHQKLVIEKHESERTFQKRDQFAPELIYFSDCILGDKQPEPSGEEGLADVQIVRAIEKSAETGRPEPIVITHSSRRPTLSQDIYRPPAAKPPLVQAAKPAQ